MGEMLRRYLQLERRKDKQNRWKTWAFSRVRFVAASSSKKKISRGSQRRDLITWSTNWPITNGDNISLESLWFAKREESWSSWNCWGIKDKRKRSDNIWINRAGKKYKVKQSLPKWNLKFISMCVRWCCLWVVSENSATVIRLEKENSRASTAIATRKPKAWTTTTQNYSSTWIVIDLPRTIRQHHLAVVVSYFREFWLVNHLCKSFLLFLSPTRLTEH